MGSGSAVEGALMATRTKSTPPAVRVYGLLGITPFWSLPSTTKLVPASVGTSEAVIATYAAFLLMFVGRKAIFAAAPFTVKAAADEY